MIEKLGKDNFSNFFSILDEKNTKNAIINVI